MRKHKLREAACLAQAETASKGHYNLAKLLSFFASGNWGADLSSASLPAMCSLDRFFLCELQRPLTFRHAKQTQNCSW